MRAMILFFLIFTQSWAQASNPNCEQLSQNIFAAHRSKPKIDLPSFNQETVSPDQILRELQAALEDPKAKELLATFLDDLALGRIFLSLDGDLDYRSIGLNRPSIFRRAFNAEIRGSWELRWNPNPPQSLEVREWLLIRLIEAQAQLRHPSLGLRGSLFRNPRSLIHDSVAAYADGIYLKYFSLGAQHPVDSTFASMSYVKRARARLAGIYHLLTRRALRAHRFSETEIRMMDLEDFDALYARVKARHGSRVALVYAMQIQNAAAGFLALSLGLLYSHAYLEASFYFDEISRKEFQSEEDYQEAVEIWNWMRKDADALLDELKQDAKRRGSFEDIEFLEEIEKELSTLN